MSMSRALIAPQARPRALSLYLVPSVPYRSARRLGWPARDVSWKDCGLRRRGSWQLVLESREEDWEEAGGGLSSCVLRHRDKLCIN